MNNDKIKETQCREALSTLTALFDKEFVESPGTDTRVFDNGLFADSAGDNAYLGIRVDGTLTIDKELAVSIAALATVDSATYFSLKVLAKTACYMEHGPHVRIKGLQRYLKNIASDHPYIEIAYAETVPISRLTFPVYRLTPNGQALVDYARRHQIEYLSDIINAHDTSVWNEKVKCAVDALSVALIR